MKTQTIDGKQYQECDVVMLETSKTNNLNDIVLNSNKTRLATLNPLTIDSKQPCTNQHLYILSNDEIKEGDWCISMNLAYKKPFQCTNLLYAKEYNCKKILATTDTSLKLPQIPTTFIQQYIDAYNNGNVIEKCLMKVEFGEISESYFDGECERLPIHIKLNENNEISILPPTVKKQMFSREEVEVLLFNLAEHYAMTSNKQEINDFNNWIKENLK